MITLSNGHKFEYMVASGALGFDGQGWWFDKPLIAMGLIKPELFTVVIRTLTRRPKLYPESNLSWIRPWTWLPWSPWSCVRFLPDSGVVNKVAMWNPGIDWWENEVGPTIDFQKIPLVGSIFGRKEDLVHMGWRLKKFPFVALEVNVSCRHSGHPLQEAGEIVEAVTAVADAYEGPIIVKVSAEQDYLRIARGLHGTAEAISLNSVPWTLVYPRDSSPMKKVGTTPESGSVSGGPAQAFNWEAVHRLHMQGALPPIGPSVTKFDDLQWLREGGAQAISFGSIHIRAPWRPTNIVIKDKYFREGIRLV